ncbi:hypothetical protein BFP97_18885 [Roseivirga sp. 4D4]|uniref:hypothetical protein n=1 Tax=Roseivirga sp. 4D4 TaxID=1889784 RepID=UPI000852EE5D|nr:hypothetical protein [Roseivirga sp. 4D4]OEK03458.1 hypothetical protein BFP97_18885 [Roseivirga sp. 4D4]
MSFFDNIVDKLFSKQSPKTAFIHEVLKRSDQEVLGFERWKKTEDAKSLLADIERAYFMKKQGIVSAVEVHLLDSQYANGFAISFNKEFSKETFSHVFDFLKDRGLEQGYKLAQGDRRVLDKDTYEETIEKWYLKPLTEVEDGVSDQKYGNILIEKTEIDRKPSYLKLMANVYQDRLYTKAKPFSELIEQLFKPIET